MAVGEITIRIPGASPPIPEVILPNFLKDENYEISAEGLAEIAERSQYGTATITGPLGDWYSFTITSILLEEDALRLGALARWSSAEGKAKRDGALELDFELEYADPEPPGHGRTFVSTLTTSYGYEYGYPRFKVLLSIPPNYRKRLGRGPNGSCYSQVSFIATEV